MDPPPTAPSALTPQLFLLPITGRRLPTGVELSAVGADDEAVLEVGHCVGLQRNHAPPPHRVHHPVVVRLHEEDLAHPVPVGVAQAIFEGHGVAPGEPVEIVEDEPAVAATEKGRGEELRPFAVGLGGTDPR